MSQCAFSANTYAGIRPIKYQNNVLSLLDQRKLPGEEIWIDYTDYQEVAEAIRSMVVRGAPAIGITAAYGAYLGATAIEAKDAEDFAQQFDAICATLNATRPTAVNLAWALERMQRLVRANLNQPPINLKIGLEYEALAIFEEDLRINIAMGQNGEKLIPDQSRILTHCNAGALATGGYGTALGVVRAAVNAGKQVMVLADETRPFLQGARLTAWELQRDKIPVTLICDNMAGYLMSLGGIDCVIVGADRVAANGDVANKIGTYSVAVLAKEHNIPFYVAAPLSTIDMNLAEGKDIPIEQRDTREISHIGETQLAPEGISILNPAFDVTPARLVSAIITERGVVQDDYVVGLKKLTGKGS